MTDSLDWSAGEARAKARVIECGEFGQRRRRQVVTRGELRFAADARELVPRADREAIVTTVNAVADQGPELRRNRPLVLDRQIRNAAPRIEFIGRGKGGCP